MLVYDCVSDQDMALLIEGKLNLGDSNDVAQHLKSCLDCRVVLREATLILEDLWLDPIEPATTALWTACMHDWVKAVQH